MTCFSLRNSQIFFRTNGVVDYEWGWFNQHHTIVANLLDQASLAINPYSSSLVHGLMIGSWASPSGYLAQLWKPWPIYRWFSHSNLLFSSNFHSYVKWRDGIIANHSSSFGYATITGHESVLITSNWSIGQKKRYWLIMGHKHGLWPNDMRIGYLCLMITNHLVYQCHRRITITITIMTAVIRTINHEPFLCNHDESK